MTSNYYPYWIEQLDIDGKINIWTKVDIPANSTKAFYIVKGPGNSDNLDGERVFDFFDDFTGSTLNASKWSKGMGLYSEPECLLSDSELTITANSVYALLHRKDSITNDFIIECKARLNSINQGATILGIADVNNFENCRVYFMEDGQFSGSGSLAVNGILTAHKDSSDFEFVQQTFCIVQTDYYKYRIVKHGSDVNMQIVNKTGFQKSNAKFTFTQTNTSNIRWKVFAVVKDLGGITYDYIFIRKYSDIEPIIITYKINDDILYI